jgi:hypothetical protein
MLDIENVRNKPVLLNEPAAGFELKFDKKMEAICGYKLKMA